MNRQRKILITVIYNDLGIIVDTKAEELDLSANLQQTCNQLATDCISRQQAIEAFEPEHHTDWYTPTIIKTLEELPQAQPERKSCKTCHLWEDGEISVDCPWGSNYDHYEDDYCSLWEKQN